ncbi:MAG: cupin domain-containing protein [Candidatus Cloacimonadota bacterium]|nr:cupin domain-containing protein [Candidatus Cloacimonadota bacterium]
MKVKNFYDENKMNNPHGITSQKMYDMPEGLIMHLQLGAGEKLKPHITPVNVAFYVLEGNPTIMVGKEKQQMQPDDLVESPKDIVHCIYNETEKLVRVLVIKMPKPTAKTIFLEEK